MSTQTPILFPVGRLIMGSCYKGSTTDSKGNPRIVKTGPNKGQPITQYFLGVAIPKGAEQHWSQTDWGQKILAVGAAAFPNFYQHPTFAWKIDDGDSTVPNKSNRKPCDAEGAKGHWIVKFSSGFAPECWQQPSPGTFVQLTQPDAVKTGYWIQVNGTVAGNGSSESPGVYVNHGKVLFVKTDAEIKNGPDAAEVFAGAAVSEALPGGAAPLPFAPQAAAPGAPNALPFPGSPAPIAAPAPLAVAPNAAFLAVPGTVAAPAMPLAPPVQLAPPPVPAATPALTPAGVAAGGSYDAFRKAGWSDEQMRAQGYLA